MGSRPVYLEPFTTTTIKFTYVLVPLSPEEQVIWADQSNLGTALSLSQDGLAWPFLWFFTLGNMSWLLPLKNWSLLWIWNTVITLTQSSLCIRTTTSKTSSLLLMYQRVFCREKLQVITSTVFSTFYWIEVRKNSEISQTQPSIESYIDSLGLTPIVMQPTSNRWSFM